MNPISLLIVDNHNLFCDGVKIGLQEEHETYKYSRIDTLYYAEDAIERLKKQSYDVVLVDVEMPYMNGVNLCKEILKINPHQVILGFSYSNTLPKIIQMLKAGAKGYLLKDSEIETMHQAIAAVHNGETYFKNHIANILIELGVTMESEELDENISFTPREIEIMTMIVEEMTNEEISEELGISIRTIEKHRENIHKKAGVKNTIGLIRFALRHDLVDEFR